MPAPQQSALLVPRSTQTLLGSPAALPQVSTCFQQGPRTILQCSACLAVLHCDLLHCSLLSPACSLVWFLHHLEHPGSARHSALLQAAAGSQC